MGVLGVPKIWERWAPPLEFGNHTLPAVASIPPPQKKKCGVDETLISTSPTFLRSEACIPSSNYVRVRCSAVSDCVPNLTAVAVGEMVYEHRYTTTVFGPLAYA